MHDLNYAREAIAEGYGKHIAESIGDYATGDHNKIALALIDAEWGFRVATNIDLFVGVNHSEIVEALIDAGQVSTLAHSVHSWGLDCRELARSIIDDGEDYLVAYYLSDFVREILKAEPDAALAGRLLAQGRRNSITFEELEVLIQLARTVGSHQKTTKAAC